MAPTMAMPAIFSHPATIRRPGPSWARPSQRAPGVTPALWQGRAHAVPSGDSLARFAPLQGRPTLFPAGESSRASRSHRAWGPRCPLRGQPRRFAPLQARAHALPFGNASRPRTGSRCPLRKHRSLARFAPSHGITLSPPGTPSRASRPRRRTANTLFPQRALRALAGEQRTRCSLREQLRALRALRPFVGAHFWDRGFAPVPAALFFLTFSANL